MLPAPCRLLYIFALFSLLIGQGHCLGPDGPGGHVGDRWCRERGGLHPETPCIWGATSPMSAPTPGIGVPVDPVTGEVVPGFPVVAGGAGALHIYAVAPDGAGGWFIGGSFGSVGGEPRANIAHINADFSVSPWNPGTSGNVFAIAVDGSIVYVGGQFGAIGGQSRFYLAAIDATTGVPTSWDPSAGWVVRTLAVTDSVVYAGGGFTTIGGTTRNYLAAIDKTTGLVNGWDPIPSNLGQIVIALAVTDTAIYVGGRFTSIGGATRYGLAGIDPVTGSVIPWNPTPVSASITVNTLALADSTLYLGGSFNSIGGVVRRSLAEFDLTTGLLTPWDPDLSNGSVSILVANGPVVYAGGWFPVTIGGVARGNIAAIDASTGAVTAWDPRANDVVNSLAISGSRLYVGGTGVYFSIGGVARKNLASIEVTTGEATSWDPSVELTGECDGARWLDHVRGWGLLHDRRRRAPLPRQGGCGERRSRSLEPQRQ